MSSGAACRAKLADKLNSIGYRSTKYDPDVWTNRVTTENGTDYYKYMLVYENDVLHLAKDAYEYILNLNQFYRLREFLSHHIDILGPTLIKFN